MIKHVLMFVSGLQESVLVNFIRLPELLSQYIIEVKCNERSISKRNDE